MGNSSKNLSELLAYGVEQIKEINPSFMKVLEREYQRQKSVLMMVASCSIVPPSVLACTGMPAVNITAEGYPHVRYHAGCEEMDKIEELAISNAKKIFKAAYANVQSHSATTANEIVTYSLVRPGGLIMGMNLTSGGHLTHGASVSYSGSDFQVVRYGLDENYLIDYDKIEELALQHRPKMIICGTTAYCRKIDFKRFREIADKVGAYLLADISHIAGLVIADLHESPIDYAHITTTCTHKQLAGPRGGLILSGKDAKRKLFDEDMTLEEKLQKAVFPFFQGAPIMNQIAAKAISFDIAASEGFKKTMQRIVDSAKILAEHLQNIGFDVISGGTDNHIVLVDLASKNISGDVAERALEECGIIVNRNSVPNKKINGKNTSKRPAGIRIGTNNMAQRKMSADAVKKCAYIIADVLNHIHGDNLEDFKIDDTVKSDVLHKVSELCKEYPIPGYETNY
ncbi:MAG: serine hydroxymethyltransferase [Oscillospiraceae bacterium]|jgi:glycine hydroxymethyltransferase|nr:serine hydroxymethyltransferase [Oscillospiraceae bacterium]